MTSLDWLRERIQTKRPHPRAPFAGSSRLEFALPGRCAGISPAVGASWLESLLSLVREVLESTPEFASIGQ